MSNIGGEGFELEGHVKFTIDEATLDAAIKRVLDKQERQFATGGSDAGQSWAKNFEKKATVASETFAKQVGGRLDAAIGSTATGARSISENLNKINLDRQIGQFKQLEQLTRTINETTRSSLGTQDAKKIASRLSAQGSSLSEPSIQAAGGVDATINRITSGASRMKAETDTATKGLTEDIHRLIIQFEDLAKAATINAEKTGAAMQSIERQQVTGQANREQTAVLQRQGAELRAQLSSQLKDQELTNSKIRIDEQSSQQQRLARTQAFYKTLGRFASESGTQIAQNLGRGFRRLIEPQQTYEQTSLLSFRRHNAEMVGVAEKGVAEQRAVSDRLTAKLSTGLAGTATGFGGLGQFTALLGVFGGGALFKGVLDDVSGLQASLAVLKDVAHGSAGSMKEAGTEAIALGADVNLPAVSAKDAADAMVALAQNGATMTDILGGGAKAALVLSRALGTEAAPAALAVSEAIHVFKLGGKDLGVTADALTIASNKSGSSLQQLVDALKQSGNQFEQTFKTVAGGKQNLTDMSAALAILGRSSIRGSDGGNALKRVLQQLASASGPVQKNLLDVAKNAGVTGTVLFDAQGHTRKFNDALFILKKGLDGYSTEQERATAVNAIFGARAAAGAIALTNNLPELVKLENQMKVTGIATKIAADKNVGFKGGMDALGSSLHAITEKVLPPLSTALGGALKGFANLLGQIVSGKGVFEQIRVAIIGVAAALGAILAAKAAVEVFGLLKIAMSGLATPMGVFSLGLAGVGAGLALLIHNSPNARSELTKLGKTVQTDVGGAFNDIAKGFEGKGGTNLNFFETIGTKAHDAATAVTTAVGQIKSGFQNGTTGSSGFFAQVGAGAATAVSTITGAAKAIPGAVHDILSGFQGTNVGQNFFTKIGEGARTAYIYVSAFAITIGQILRAGFEGTGSGALTGVAAFIESVGREARKATDLVTHLASGIGSLFSSSDNRSFGDKISGIFKGLGSDLDNLLGNIPSKVSGWVDKNIVGPIERAVGSITDAFHNAFSGGFSIAGVLTFIHDIAQRLGRTITSILTDPTVLKVVGALFAGLGAVALAAVQGLIEGVIQKIGDRLAGIFRAIANSPGVKQFLTIFQPILDIGGKLVSAFSGVGKAISGILAGALIAGFAFSKVKGPLSEFTGGVKKQLDSISTGGQGVSAFWTRITKGSDAAAIQIASNAAKIKAKQDEVAKQTSANQAIGIPAADKVKLAASQYLTQINDFDSEMKTRSTRLASDPLSFIGPILDPRTDPRFQQARTGFGSFLDDLQAKAKSGAEKIGGAISTGLGKIGIDSAAFAPISGAFSDFAGKVGGTLGPAFDTISAKVHDVVGKLGGIKGAAETAGAALGGFFSGQSIASGGAGGTIGGILGAVGAIGAGFAVGGPIGAGIAAAATGIGFFTAKSDAAKQATAQIAQAAGDMAKQFDAVGKAGIPFLSQQGAAKTLSDILHKDTDGLKGLGGQAKTVETALGKAFAAFGSGHPAQGFNTVEQALEGVYKKSGQVYVGFGNIDDAAKKAGVSAQLGSSSGLGNVGLLRTKSDADAVVLKLREMRAASGDANQAFNDFDVKKVGDSFTVVERGFKGVSGDTINLLSDLAKGALTVKDAFTLANGPLGEMDRKMKDNNDVLQHGVDLAQLMKGNLDDQKTAWNNIKTAATNALQNVKGPGGQIFQDEATNANDLQSSILNVVDAFANLDEKGNVTSLKAKTIPDMETLTRDAIAQRASLQDLGNTFRTVIGTQLADPTLFKSAKDAVAGVFGDITNLHAALSSKFGPKLADEMTAAIQQALPDSAAIQKIWDDNHPGGAQVDTKIKLAPIPAIKLSQTGTGTISGAPSSSFTTTPEQDAASKAAVEAQIAASNAKSSGKTYADSFKSAVKEGTKDLPKQVSDSLSAGLGGAGKQFASIITGSLQPLLFIVPGEFRAIGLLSGSSLAFGASAGMSRLGSIVQTNTIAALKPLTGIFQFAVEVASIGAAQYAGLGGTLAGDRFVAAFGAAASGQRIASFIQGAFSGLGSAVNSAAGSIAGSVQLIFTSFGSAIQQAVANTISQFNLLKLAISGSGISPIPSRIDLKLHALGGIVTKPELSIVGEAGPEAILPLSDPARSLEILKMSGLLGKFSQTATTPTGATVKEQATGMVFNQINHFNQPVFDEAGTAAYVDQRTRATLLTATK